ncbi:MAG: sensor histidine kinase [Blastocatellia bacterium]
MTTQAVALLNLLGFITGTALYAMLLVMVLSQSRTPAQVGAEGKPDRLPLLTSLLGLAWNLGALATVGLHGLGVGPAPRASALLDAASFTALGFLPAVMVHSVLRTDEGRSFGAAFRLIALAYLLSAAAGILHFHQAIASGIAPAHWALHILTIGFVALTLALLAYTWRQTKLFALKRAGWVVALSVFSVSALHLSHHDGQNYSWWIELVGHHASLPLAFVILYQDYRFALADIFLKRALSLVLLVGLAFGLYLGVAEPLMSRRAARGDAPLLATGLLLGLWVATALVYPLLRRVVDRFVDAIVLRRADYALVRTEIAERIAQLESPEMVLDEVGARLSDALTARDVRWAGAERGDADARSGPPSGSLLPLVERHKSSAPKREALATVVVPTAEPPQYRLLIRELAGGRRLLSDDLALLESAAVMAARRIDAVRAIHERCRRDLHEQEMHQLATEAELRALRAQVNPHFLFNALTTIGYLIQTTPDRALETLMRLTALLRGVLRNSGGEFSTLGEESELIASYLEIERARFEDRLRVTIDVPAELRDIRIPALLVQPLVENAIKHGISPQRAGGDVEIRAWLEKPDILRILVRDTGAGASQAALQVGRESGVGIANVEQRIQNHFGDAGLFRIQSIPGAGTTVELALPVPPASVAATLAAATSATIGGRS